MEKNRIRPMKSGKSSRMSYSRQKEVLQMPNLIEVQKDSYDWFLKSGLKEVFEDISPIEDYSDQLSLEFVDYQLCKDDVKYSIEECKERDATYAAPLKVKVRLHNKETDEINEHEIFMGDLPLMTATGTFVINGAERVIVSQLVRSPGIYYGIGARVSLDTETQLPKIASVISGTPAEEAGLMANDLLYKADDTELQGMDLSSAVALIRGEEGTTVHLTVIRSGESNYLEFDVVRRKLANETVTSKMLDDSMAYIQIQEFDDVTLDQFTEALDNARSEGMEGLIIDLRGNPGGNLSTVCDICRELLPKGLIVYTEDKYGNREEYSCDGTNPLEVPLVVLVDGNSASASEIMSGAVKDYGIGTLVGTTTYGKGIVQRIMQLTDNSAVKLTVSKYYTPKGNNIHKIGIEPDVEVEFDAQAYVEDGTDNQLNKAMEVLQEKMAE